MYGISTLRVYAGQVNDRPYLYSKSGASVAVDRYERCWLPLLMAHDRNDRLLYPPLDVAWVWFVHAICPQRYAEVSHIMLVSFFLRPLFVPNFWFKVVVLQYFGDVRDATALERDRAPHQALPNRSPSFPSILTSGGCRDEALESIVPCSTSHT